MKFLEQHEQLDDCVHAHWQTVASGKHCWQKIRYYRNRSHVGKKWDFKILAAPEHQPLACRTAVGYLSPFAVPIQSTCSFLLGSYQHTWCLRLTWHWNACDSGPGDPSYSFLHFIWTVCLLIVSLAVPITRRTWCCLGLFFCYKVAYLQKAHAQSCFFPLMGSVLCFPWFLNHKMVGVGRDLCGSSSPTLLLKQGHLQ